jgi:Na+/proline symporter
MILVNIPIAALSFALLAGFYWKRVSRAGAWASVLVGIAWAVGCYAYFGEQGGYTWYWALYGIPLIFLTGAVVSLCERQPTGAGVPGNAPQAEGPQRTAG